MGRPQGLERCLGVWVLHSVKDCDVADVRVETESHW